MCFSLFAFPFFCVFLLSPFFLPFSRDDCCVPSLSAYLSFFPYLSLFHLFVNSSCSLRFQFICVLFCVQCVCVFFCIYAFDTRAWLFPLSNCDLMWPQVIWLDDVIHFYKDVKIRQLWARPIERWKFNNFYCYCTLQAVWYARHAHSWACLFCISEGTYHVKIYMVLVNQTLYIVVGTQLCTSNGKSFSRVLCIQS